jgi:hypothetical protein
MAEEDQSLRFQAITQEKQHEDLRLRVDATLTRLPWRRAKWNGNNNDKAFLFVGVPT